jgi:hypothetical protein
MPVLIETKKNKAITVSELLKSIEGFIGDTTEDHYVTIDSIGGKGLLDVIIYYKEGNLVQLVCKHNDIKNLNLSNNDILLNNIFKDFVSISDFIELLSKLPPHIDIYLSFGDDDTLFPLTLASRCDSKPCFALHLYCIEDIDLLSTINLN